MLYACPIQGTIYSTGMTTNTSSKENTVLRGQLDPHLVSVIPNAVDTTVFTPDPSVRDPNTSMPTVSNICLEATRQTVLPFNFEDLF
jgi:hypothetical protein